MLDNCFADVYKSFDSVNSVQDDRDGMNREIRIAVKVLVGTDNCYACSYFRFFHRPGRKR